jgi:hypothetical protein
MGSFAEVPSLKLLPWCKHCSTVQVYQRSTQAHCQPDGDNSQTMAKIATPSKSQRTIVRGRDSPENLPSGFGCDIHEIEGRMEEPNNYDGDAQPTEPLSYLKWGFTHES